MEVGKTNTVAQQISVEEYDKQKSEYTQNALKELREQMRNIENNYENPKKKIQKIIPESDNESDNNINESDNINILIQSDLSKNNKLRHRKNNTSKTNEIDSQLFEKYDQSHKIIQGLKDVNNELESEIISLDNRLHFMKLELANITVDIGDLQKKHNYLIIENNKLKQDLDTEKKKINYEKSLNAFLLTLIFIQFLMIFFY
jgi:chromosome segregation ATPase